MKLQEIIDEIWEANQNSFSSKKELERIVNAYLNLLNKNFKAIKKIKLDGIGFIEPTRHGSTMSKNKAEAQRKKTNALISEIKRRTLTVWRLKFIEDCFPD